jgi:hypothetical protein
VHAQTPSPDWGFFRQAAREESVLVVPEGGGKFEENLGMVMDGHTGIEHALPITPIHRDVVELFSKSQSGYTPTLLVAYGGLSGEHWFYQHYDVFDDPKLRRFTPRPYPDARAIRRPVMAPDWDWHHIAVAAGADRIVQAGRHFYPSCHARRLADQFGACGSRIGPEFTRPEWFDS